MLRINTQKSIFLICFLWTLSIAGAWALYTYPGLTFRDVLIHSWSGLFSTLGTISIQMALLGLLVGFLQYILLRTKTNISFWWIFISGASYSIGLILAILLVTISLVGLNQNAFANILFALPFAPAMVIAGAFIGIIQALMLKDLISGDLKKFLLWSLASSLGWGLAFFTTSIAWGAGLSMQWQSGLAGLCVGGVTVLALIIINKNTPEHTITI
jgi:hypothetical protein